MAMKILVDGSNTLFWRANTPQSDVPHIVLRALLARRFLPVVYFDHSVLRYLDNGALSGLENLAQVHIAPRDTPADALLLAACAQGRFQIVSNDRFSDWHRQYPQLNKRWRVSGRIGKGGAVSFSKTLRAAPL